VSGESEIDDLRSQVVRGGDFGHRSFAVMEIGAGRANREADVKASSDRLESWLRLSWAAGPRPRCDAADIAFVGAPSVVGGDGADVVVADDAPRAGDATCSGDTADSVAPTPLLRFIKERARFDFGPVWR